MTERCVEQLRATDGTTVPCSALAVDTSGLCAVHRRAMRAPLGTVGLTCAACGRRIAAEDWVTRESSADAMRHAACPPSPSRRRRRDAPSLLDGIGALDGVARPMASPRTRTAAFSFDGPEAA